MLALIQGEPLPAGVVRTIHFGCTLAQPEAVHAVRQRLRTAGAREVEWEDPKATWVSRLKTRTVT